MSYQRAIIPPTQRINELLEALKQEFETVTNEASLYRMHKDDFDHKCMFFILFSIVLFFYGLWVVGCALGQKSGGACDCYGMTGKNAPRAANSRLTAANGRILLPDCSAPALCCAVGVRRVAGPSLSMTWVEDRHPERRRECGVRDQNLRLGVGH
ncbi:hypothetical protein V1527DRAFT_456388 [Lipomyces starkeyi]